MKSFIRKKIFYLIIFLIPILFFILLELSLRYFNYGLTHEQWVESNNGQWIEPGGKLLMLNPDIAFKYFHVNKNVPVPNQEAFEKIKKENSFRVFILGESSAAGYPYEPNGSFSRYLKDRLTLAYPNSKIEVINCSMSAINSYTLLDLTPGILKQKPDLILIYAGHNEYYGALGAGSIESAGRYRFLVNLAISLEKYRTFQLIRNTLTAVSNIFSDQDTTPRGTLMERMVEEQYISYDSDTYKNGLSQFEGNLNDIIKMIEEADVPVIISTLTSNLKDQPPFISITSSGYPDAEKIFKDAKKALLEKNITTADSLFRFARDLDALRFRAPGEINNIIYRLSEKYAVPVLNIDSAFNAKSPDQIVGNNLLVDHLHPALAGYKQMGKMFFEKMKELNYLPGTTPLNLSEQIQDSITEANFSFSKLDSIIADYKIIVLKNNWPFVKNTNSSHEARQFNYSDYMHPKNRIDSLAYEFIEQKTRWKDVHLLAAAWYLENKDFINFLREMNVIIDQYPYVNDYYQYTVQALLPLKAYEQAYKYLMKSYNIEPTAFSTKWLGSIYLNNSELDSARFFLNQSLLLNAGDPQVWFNLAVTYLNEDKNQAVALINRALDVNPDYQNALILRRQILNSLK